VLPVDIVAPEIFMIASGVVKPRAGAIADKIYIGSVNHNQVVAHERTMIADANHAAMA